MKKPYEELELEVIRFTAEDVITASAEEAPAEEPAPAQPAEPAATTEEPAIAVIK